jgi:hypothetical protein
LKIIAIHPTRHTDEIKVTAGDTQELHAIHGKAIAGPPTFDQRLTKLRLPVARCVLAPPMTWIALTCFASTLSILVASTHGL